MATRREMQRVTTGIPSLDSVFSGGMPKGSVTVLSGPPGSGKTILTQQICFHHASPKARVLYFNTLSEPTAKTLRYLQPFEFFDEKKFSNSIQFVDLGGILRADGLESARGLLMQHLKRVKPSLVVIDSFKAFDDLAQSREELRKFGYEIAVTLMAWEATALLLGEYGSNDYETNPLFSIIDGLVVLSQREASGEHQRFLRAVKMRGTAHSRDEHSFLISSSGIQLFPARVLLKRGPEKVPVERCHTGIAKLDELLGPGIPLGSSVLVSGVAGTGKTVLGLEFLYAGAKAGEKGIFFSFEETRERLCATARGLGWDLDAEIDRGMVEIVFIPQPEIMVEAHILLMRERIEAAKSKRVVVDSLSVYLHKVKDPQLSREKVFHLCSIVQNARAVALFTTDIPYGSTQISRFGVEETVVDGVIILSSSQEGLERQRYIEVYKMRNTAHLKGRHNMTIDHGGIAIFPRYGDRPAAGEPAPMTIDVTKRIPSGIGGLDALLHGGLVERSITLVSGSAGIGKSTLGVQFILAGAARGDRGLYVSLEEGAEQLSANAESMKLPLRAAIEDGLVEVLYLSRENIRAGQFLTVLADKIEGRGVKRLVLDAVTHMVTELMPPDELRHVLYKLVVRFKQLGVTSMLTLESSSLESLESVTDQGLSPIADNLFMLRYMREGASLTPIFRIVKTRGSGHDPGLHPLHLGAGGMRIGNSSPGEAPRPRTARKAKRRP